MNDSTRREFLRKAIQVGGLAAVFSLGAGAIEDARAWNMLPGVSGKRTTGGGGSTWASWAAASESTLSTSQGGGTDNTHVMFCENPVLGGNETGVGYETGANLVWTDKNANVPGALGAPPSRALDTDKALVCELPLSNILTLTDTFSVILKVKDWTTATQAAVIYFAGAGGTDLGMFKPADKTLLRCVVDIGGVSKLGANTAATPAGTFWVAVCCDGTDYFGGWTNAGSGAGGQPTKYSDFTGVGGGVSNTVAPTQFAAGSLGTFKHIGWDSTYATVTVFLAVLSRACLIDKAA